MPSYITGYLNGEHIKINNTFSGHVYTDEEVTKLFNGEFIDFPIKDRTGKIYRIQGRLGIDPKVNSTTIKFIPDFNFKTIMATGLFKGNYFNIQKNMPYHCLTDNEIEVLSRGGSLIYTEVDLDGNVFQVKGKFNESLSMIGNKIDYITKKTYLYTLYNT